MKHLAEFYMGAAAVLAAGAWLSTLTIGAFELMLGGIGLFVFGVVVGVVLMAPEGA